jgi:hypothetical protein
MKMIGLPDNPAAVAKRELPPPAPSVQLPTVATPLLSLVADAPVIVPPPLRMPKTTAIPATGPPVASVIRTAGRIATAVSGDAVCPSPAKMVIVVAGS